MERLLPLSNFRSLNFFHVVRHSYVIHMFISMSLLFYSLMYATTFNAFFNISSLKFKKTNLVKRQQFFIGSINTYRVL